MDLEERPEDAARKFAKRVIELKAQRDAAVAILRASDDDGSDGADAFAIHAALAALGADAKETP